MCMWSTSNRRLTGWLCLDVFTQICDLRIWGMLCSMIRQSLLMTSWARGGDFLQSTTVSETKCMPSCDPLYAFAWPLHHLERKLIPPWLGRNGSIGWPFTLKPIPPQAPDTHTWASRLYNTRMQLELKYVLVLQIACYFSLARREW